ncbi:MAG: GGDEF domain-containing protein [Chroococcales cyanobacterium]
MTGLANQLKSSRDLELLVQQETPLCFVLLSIDSFTKINRQYGHSIGNQVLKRWGNLLQSSFRNEVVGYWGNGEFVVGISGLNSTQGRDRIANSLTALRKQVFTAIDGSRFQVNCQVAIAAYPRDGLTVQYLYQMTASRFEII